MPIKLATHLYRNRHGTFYFRLVIPQDLRDHVQQREFRFSLNTEQRHQAIIEAIPLVADLQHLISDLKHMADNNEPVPPDYFQLWKEEKQNAEELRNWLRLAYGENDGLKAQLQERINSSFPKPEVKLTVIAANQMGQVRGRREVEKSLVFPWLPERTVLFSELKAAYMSSLSYRPAGGVRKPPTPKTVEEYDRTLDLFIKVMGDCRIGSIDKAIAGKYFGTLKRLPANIGKKVQYRGKSVLELLAMDAPPQSETTCSKKIERISSMFKWALEEKRKWGIDANPFTGFGQSDSKETPRRPFTTDELGALLSHPDFVKNQFSSTYSFWLIPIATYTGARLGELCQLDLKDFIEVDGIQCIDINDDDAVDVIAADGGRKKRVKTKNAKRLVPVHSELIRIGILRYVATLRKNGTSQHLFPELSRTRRDGPAAAASNWFARFRKRVGINTKQDAVFHSFRHQFITNIIDGGVSPHMLAPIVGHEADLITGQVYWNKRDATKRLPTVEAFVLPDSIRRRFPTIEEVEFIQRRRSNRREN